MSLKTTTLSSFLVFVFASSLFGVQNRFYRQSYAVVVGINEYRSPGWADLTYARKDAEGIADFLKTQGFKVISLYDKRATKEQIEQNLLKLAHQFKEVARKEQGDRFLFFFAGHGTTERLAGRSWGYIVPHDATRETHSYISMDSLQTMSAKMGDAKHQLFIMDACYGGLLAQKRSSMVDPSVHNYLEEITQRQARQILTAGGEGDEVDDRGRNGHSVFTGCLLDALKGDADLNKDGYITFAELSATVQSRASTRSQTPAFGRFGNGLGEFVFRSPEGGSYRNDEPSPPRPPGSTRGGRIKLRSSSKTISGFEEMAAIIRLRGFHVQGADPEGTFQNNYEDRAISGDNIVVDHTTGLMWQQSGSEAYSFSDARGYLDGLNSTHYASYSDWRVPTMEELASLLEPTKQNGELYISSLFNSKQVRCWSADETSYNPEGHFYPGRWVVEFRNGTATFASIDSLMYVRGVRSITSPTAIGFTFSPLSVKPGDEVELYLSSPLEWVSVYFNQNPLPKKILGDGSRIVITIPGGAETDYLELRWAEYRVRATKPLVVE